MSLWSAIFDIGKTAASIIPGVGTYLSAVDTNQTNRELQEQANKDNIRLWQMQTEYNTPINQMKRLEAAGLNPNLAYGQVAESRMATPPTMEAAHMEAPKPPSLADFQQVVNMHTQNQLQRAQIEQVAQQTAASSETARATKANADYQEYENKVLMAKGLIKSDSPLVKVSGRVSDYLKTEVAKPISKVIDNSSLWQGILNASERFGYGLGKNKTEGWRTRYVERYGSKGGKK